MSTRPFHAAWASLLLAGCAIPPASSVGTPIGRVQPERYCPGDTLWANHHVFTRTCFDQPGHRCADLTPPRVTYHAVTGDFPDETVSAMDEVLTFVPRGDSVEVQFTVDPSPYGVTYVRGSDTGFIHDIRILRSNVATARRLTETTDVEVASSPRCDKNGQLLYPNEWVPIPENFSWSVQGLRVCNLSEVPIVATLHDLSSGGPRPDIPLAVGACADTGRPEFHLNGIEPMVTLRPASLDPGTKCSSVATNPLFALRARVTLGCLP